MNRSSLLLIVSFIGFALVVAASPVSAVPTGELRVGYVDLQKALASSKEGSKAKSTYEHVVKEAQKELDKKKKELERMRAEFDKQRDSLSDEARMEKQESLLSVERDLRRSFKDSEEQLRRRNAQLVGKLLKKIRTVVDKVGKEQGFTLILEKGSQAVLYADNSIDVTEIVVKKFNAME